MLTDLACNSNNYYWLNNKGRERTCRIFPLFQKIGEAGNPIPITLFEYSPVFPPFLTQKPKPSAPSALVHVCTDSCSQYSLSDNDRNRLTYVLDTIQDFLCKVGMKPHKYASSGNNHFFTNVAL